MPRHRNEFSKPHPKIDFFRLYPMVHTDEWSVRHALGQATTEAHSQKKMGLNYCCRSRTNHRSPPFIIYRRPFKEDLLTRSSGDLIYDLAHFAGRDPHNLYDLLQHMFFWVGSVLRRSCATSQNGRRGTR